MNTIRTFEKDVGDKICYQYQEEGQTLTFLARFYHCRDEAIRAVLLKNNIPIKRKGLSKNRLLKEDFFDIIDTEEKAYFLGLMFADGNVSLDKKRSPMISISLKASDIKILQDFREILNMHSNLRYDKRKNKDCAILSFRSAHMAETLSKYGIIPNKTYKTKHLPQISSEFLHHFLRGLVDGDGSIYQEGKSKKYRIDYCSYHQSICEEFRELCNMFLIKKNTIKINNYGSAYHVRFNDQYSVKQLATVLYKDSKISLARKYSLAREIFEDNSEDDIVYSDH